ncbi:MAG: hypothetical protein RL527_635, partial [Planctomycetota bacterium]
MPILALAVVLVLLAQPIEGLAASPVPTAAATDGPSDAAVGPAPSVPGLSKPVTITFDEVDVPTIAAATETDAARAL